MYTLRQWPSLELWIPRGADRQSRHCKIKTRDLIGPVPFSRAQCAELIRKLRAAIRSADTKKGRA